MLLREDLAQSGVEEAFGICLHSSTTSNASGQVHVDEKGAYFFLERLIQLYKDQQEEDQGEFFRKFPASGLDNIGVSHVVESADAASKLAEHVVRRFKALGASTEQTIQLRDEILRQCVTMSDNIGKAYKGRVKEMTEESSRAARDFENKWRIEHHKRMAIVVKLAALRLSQDRDGKDQASFHRHLQTGSSFAPIKRFAGKVRHAYGGEDMTPAGVLKHVTKELDAGGFTELAGKTTNLRESIMREHTSDDTDAAETEKAKAIATQLTAVGHVQHAKAVTEAVEKSHKERQAAALSQIGDTGKDDAVQELLALTNALGQQGHAAAADELFEIGHQVSTGQGDISDLSESAARVAGMLEAEGRMEEAKRVLAAAAQLRNVSRAAESAKIAELGLAKDQLQDQVEALTEKMTAMTAQIGKLEEELSVKEMEESPELNTDSKLPMQGEANSGQLKVVDNYLRGLKTKVDGEVNTRGKSAHCGVDDRNKQLASTGRKFLDHQLMERNRFMEQVREKSAESRGVKPRSGKGKGKGKGKGGPPVRGGGGKGKGGPPARGKGGKGGGKARAGAVDVWPGHVDGFKPVGWARSVIIEGSTKAEGTIWETRREEVDAMRKDIFTALKKDDKFTEDFQVLLHHKKAKWAGLEPKKPKPAKKLFEAAKKDTLKKRNPLVPAKEVPAVLEEMWKSLSESEKDAWTEKAKAAQEKYDADLKDFLAKGGQLKSAAATAGAKAAPSKGPKENSRPMSVGANRLQEVDILLSGFLLKFYPKADRKTKPKEMQYDELVLLMRGYVLEMSDVVFQDSSILTGIARSLPQVDRGSNKDEAAELLKHWKLWCLNGDQSTGRSDPLMSTAEGKTIMNQGDGERPVFQERFMLGLLEIPAAQTRLAVMAQMQGHEDNLVDILRRIDILRRGVKAIHGSKELITFIEVALGVGNYLCAKRKFGQDLRDAKPKFGVQFDGLFCFEDTRSNSHRRNLMQALVQTFIGHVGEEKASFHTELTDLVREASHLKPEVLDNDVAGLRDSLVRVRATLEEVPRAGGGFVDNYHAKVKDHLEKCDMSQIEESFSNLYDEFEAAGRFFGFDPFFFSYDSTPMEQFFEDVLKLFHVYDEAMVAIKRGEHMAQLKAERHARRVEKDRLAKENGEDFKGGGGGNEMAKLDGKMEGQARRARRRAPPVKFEDEMANMLAARRKKMGLKEVRT